jgi:hypothetical protein
MSEEEEFVEIKQNIQKKKLKKEKKKVNKLKELERKKIDDSNEITQETLENKEEIEIQNNNIQEISPENEEILLKEEKEEFSSEKEINVTKYIQKKGLDSLIKRYSLKVQKHHKYPNLIQLTYDQINSSFKSKIVQECRGIILDTDNNFKLISFPYIKFFNYGEGNAAKIDWKSSIITEKLDGKY